MSRPLRLWALLSVFSWISLQSLQAQGGAGGGRENRSPEEVAKMQTARMKELLQLTPDQEKPILAANTRFADRMAAARKEAAAAGGRPDIDSVRNWSRQRDAALKAILTEAQYEKMVQEREENRRQRPPGGNGGGRRRQANGQ